MAKPLSDHIKKYRTKLQAAEAFGVPPSTLYRWLKMGAILHQGLVFIPAQSNKKPR